MKASILSKRNKLYVVITYEDMLGNTKKKWYGTGLDESKANMKLAESLKYEKLEEFKKELERSKTETSKLLFADFIQDWLERAKPNLQVSTYSTYKMQVDRIAEYFRERQIALCDLQPMDIANFYSYLMKQGKTVQHCEHLHVNIRKCLQTAVKANLIAYNPADRIDRPRSPKHIARFYTKDELDALFEALIGDDYAHIYKLTAYYGLRRSEVMGLKWENIDFNKNTITLKHAVIQTRVNGKSIIVAKDILKNTSSLRTLPLLPEVKNILLDLKEKQEKNRKLYGSQYTKQYEKYVLVDDLGYRLNPETVSSHFRLVLKNNKLKKITFHELRHSCASLLLAQGVSMKEIQEWLGHSSYNTTANIYSHLDDKSKINVANVISKTFDEEELQAEEVELPERENEVIEFAQPKPLYKVRHKDNRNTIELNLENTPANIENNIEEIEQIIQKDKSKYIYVGINLQSGNLSMSKRFSDLDENFQYVGKAKNIEEANSMLLGLFMGGDYERDYLNEFSTRLKKKIKELENDNEM